MIDLYDNSEHLKTCPDASLFCRQEPNPCCRYYSNYEKRCGNYECFHWNENYWSWSKPGLLRFTLVMLIQFLVQFTILILIEVGFFRKIKYSFKKRFEKLTKLSVKNEKIKTDVIEEEKLSEKILSHTKEKLFIASKLYKRYSNLLAVKNLSFDIENNECFGLLGI